MCPSSGSTGPSFTTNSSGLISPHPKRHFDRFIRFRRTHAGKRQTHRLTDHATCVTVGCFLYYALRCGLKSTKSTNRFGLGLRSEPCWERAHDTLKVPQLEDGRVIVPPSPSRRRSDARLDVHALTLYRAIAGPVDSSSRHSSSNFLDKSLHAPENTARKFERCVPSFSIGSDWTISPDTQ